jgi:hypothetical protein
MQWEQSYADEGRVADRDSTGLHPPVGRGKLLVELLCDYFKSRSSFRGWILSRRISFDD